MAASDVDVVVIGSGFGGSVAALRLVEKGYRVEVLEAGRRFRDDEFATTSWKLRDFLWLPALGLTGIQRIHVLRDIIVLAGAGVGGGSLVYANTLYRPSSDNFYRDPQWSHITDWRDELAPYYDQASRMLGVVTNPTMTPSDVALKKTADDMGIGDTFTLAPVGVFFGADGEQPGVTSPDPYFGGVGPDRTGCIQCGECMSGCRHNAKNTLVKNYLHLAERGGATVSELTTVVDVRPRPEGGYAVDVVSRRTGRRARRTILADQVVVAAGTWGTQNLLHRLKLRGSLPAISDRLGHLTRTNSEALGGAMTRMRSPLRPEFHRGVAITSSIHPDDHTHIEPVRYGVGSNVMALLCTPLTDGDGRMPRWLRWLGLVLRRPGLLGSLYGGIRTWSDRTVITLTMQSLDNSITVFARRRFGRVSLISRQGHGTPNPTWIPAANRADRILAKHIDGNAYGSVGEIVNVPMTAHFLGGCVIGDSPESGVVDPYHRVFGYEGLHIVDGSAVTANLGVNPSLTIAAQAERAFAHWPNRGDTDPRPALGAPYVRVAPVAPARPIVPATAPGALRLPIVRVT